MRMAMSKGVWNDRKVRARRRHRNGNCQSVGLYHHWVLGCLVNWPIRCEIVGGWNLFGHGYKNWGGSRGLRRKPIFRQQGSAANEPFIAIRNRRRETGHLGREMG